MHSVLPPTHAACPVFNCTQYLIVVRGPVSGTAQEEIGLFGVFFSESLGYLVC